MGGLCTAMAAAPWHRDFGHPHDTKTRCLIMEKGSVGGDGAFGAFYGHTAALQLGIKYRKNEENSAKRRKEQR